MTSENPLQLIHGDARHIPLADGSVQCIVTSPPYWGLRKYAGNQELIWEPPVVALGDTLLCAAEGHLWITEENVGGGKVNGKGDGGPKARARAKEGVHEDWAESTRDVLGYRNIRNVWMFPTQPYSGAHFATFPEELPRRCILAATSARGACTQCGAPWERVTSKPEGARAPTGGKHGAADPQSAARRMMENTQGRRDLGNDHDNPFANPETIGWRPTCTCSGQHGKTAPCLVLDPFGGSGTTGRVALELRRRAVLVDIAYDAEYRELAERRTSGVNVKLPFL